MNKTVQGPGPGRFLFVDVIEIQIACWRLEVSLESARARTDARNCCDSTFRPYAMWSDFMQEFNAGLGHISTLLLMCVFF